MNGLISEGDCEAQKLESISHELHETMLSDGFHPCIAVLQCELGASSFQKHGGDQSLQKWQLLTPFSDQNLLYEAQGNENVLKSYHKPVRDDFVRRVSGELSHNCGGVSTSEFPCNDLCGVKRSSKTDCVLGFGCSEAK